MNKSKIGVTRDGFGGPSRSAALSLLIGLLLLSGCASSGGDTPKSTDYTEQELQEDLAGYAARYSSITSAAADEIADLTDSRRVRRSTLVWKLRMIPLVKEHAFRDDPKEAYVEVLNLAAATRHYLTAGDGKALFGGHKEIAVEAVRELEGEAVDIGNRLLGPERMARLMEEIEAVVEKNPIRGRDFSIESVQAALADVERGASFGWIMSIPLSPFRALEGLDSAAMAIHDMNTTAAQFSQVIQGLPQENRWQIELLLYDVEDRDTVMESLAAVKQIAESADRVSRAVERLPADLRELLNETQGPIGELKEAIADARELMKPVAATVQDVGEIARIVAAMQEADPRPAEALPGRPFDIREYDSAAQSVRGSASELREFVGELHELVDSGKLDGSFVRAVDKTEDEIAQLVDKVTLHVVLTILAFFALLVTTRWLSWRLRSAQHERS